MISCEFYQADKTWTGSAKLPVVPRVGEFVALEYQPNPDNWVHGYVRNVRYEVKAAATVVFIVLSRALPTPYTAPIDDFGDPI